MSATDYFLNPYNWSFIGFLFLIAFSYIKLQAFFYLCKTEPRFCENQSNTIINQTTKLQDEKGFT